MTTNKLNKEIEINSKEEKKAILERLSEAELLYLIIALIVLLSITMYLFLDFIGFLK